MTFRKDAGADQHCKNNHVRSFNLALENSKISFPHGRFIPSRAGKASHFDKGQKLAVPFLLYTVPMKTARDVSLDAISGKSINRVRFFRSASSCGGAVSVPKYWQSLRAALVLTIVFSLAFSAGISEVQTAAPQSANPGPFPDPFHAAMDGPFGREQIEKQYKELNIQRQKQLASDSAKLLALATELNAEIEKEASSEPTEADARKAALIEKLARSVRDKMREANSPTQSMPPIPRR
jgi:Skp family chaperone for outer membrane proteins